MTYEQPKSLSISGLMSPVWAPFRQMDILRAEGNLGSAQGFLTEASSVNGGQTRNSQSDLPNALTS